MVLLVFNSYFFCTVPAESVNVWAVVQSARKDHLSPLSSSSSSSSDHHHHQVPNHLLSKESSLSTSSSSSATTTTSSSSFFFLQSTSSNGNTGNDSLLTITANEGDHLLLFCEAFGGRWCFSCTAFVRLGLLSLSACLLLGFFYFPLSPPLPSSYLFAQLVRREK